MFKLAFNSPSHSVRCVVWNVQSLCNKVDEVISVFSDNDIDFGFVCETWLSSQENNITSILRSAGYNIAHSFRKKRGGGVGIVWHNNLDKRIKVTRNCSDFSTFQYQSQLFHGSIKLNFICLYRLQETPFNLFIQEFKSLLSELDLSHPLVLSGDFNVHFEISESSKVKLLLDVTALFGLSNHVVGPTHKLGHTLDLVFANNFDLSLQVTQPVSYNIGDHFPIFFELPNVIKRNSAPKKKTVATRNFKNLDISNLASQLGTSLTSSMSECAESSSFSELLQVYNNTIDDELNNVAPLQTRTFPISSAPPWIDAEYRTNRAERRRLERRWKRTRLAEDKAQYGRQLRVCAGMCKAKRSAYYKDLIASKRGDQRALYSIVNRLFDKNKSSGILPEYADAKVLANTFNKYYINKVDLLRSKIPVTDPIFASNYASSFSGTLLTSFRPTTEKEIRDILKDSGIKTSFHDKLPANILKQVIDELIPHLCNLVNKSLLTGSCDGIKESTIIPLLKKAGLDPDILKNYRPVADLVFLSKLIERSVAKQLFEHMTLNNLHCEHQHAYKPFHSTETLLLYIVDDCLIAFDSKSAVLLLFIDLSAAFDTVDIDKLLHILLTDIGISGTALKWFESFLTGRKQQVLIEQTLSDFLEVNFGVPQGSVLGPVLFNIYTRSLFSVIKNRGFRTGGYADDNNASLSFSFFLQFQLVASELPKLMSDIKIWMNDHFLKINPDKTEIIVFLPESMQKEQIIHGAFIEGECIRFSNTVKSLGFKLDRFLNMEEHVNSTVSLRYKLLGDVSCVRHLLSDKDTESLVHSIVSSRLDYGNSLLYGINKNVLRKYQHVQNYAARIISKQKKRQSVGGTLKKLHWLPIEERIIFKRLTFTYKIFNGLAPDSFSSLISIRDRNNYLLNNVYLNSSYGRRSFSYTAPRFWNALPLNIRSSVSLDTFKRLTKNHLFNNFTSFKSAAFMYHQM